MGYDTTIDYLAIGVVGSTSTDFGERTIGSGYGASTADATRGVWAGGEAPSPTNIIDYVTIQTPGNATDFGDLSQSVTSVGACSNGTRGVFSSGSRESVHGPVLSMIEYITIASPGNTTDFGEMTDERYSVTSSSGD